MTTTNLCTDDAAAIPEGHIEVRCPTDDRVIGQVPIDGPGSVCSIVDDLREAQPTWAALPVTERVAWLGRFRDWIYANQDRLGQLLADETGKPAAEVGVEFATSLAVLRYYSKHAEEFLADDAPHPSSLLTALKKLRTHRVPYQVVGVISPWNFPVAMFAWDTIAALLAGCAVVVKPSEHTPLTTTAMVAGWSAIGAPAVFTVANGAAATGSAVVEMVDYVHFTGSTRTGRAIAVQAAADFKPYSLELGGKDPAIVLSDADLDLAAAGIVFNGLLNSGQMCVSVERVYVDAQVHDEFVAKVVDRVRALRADGDGFDRDITGLITRMQHAVVSGHIDDAVAKGATALTGWKPSSWDGTPAVLVDVTHDMDVMVEETFGPVLPIMRFSDVEEAVALANDSDYGLSASVWSRDHAAARAIARRLEVGTVDINDAATHILCHPTPQTGWKDSGVGGRLGGAAGIRKFTRTQVITENRVDLPVVTSLAGFPYSSAKSGLLDRVGRLTDGGRLSRRLGVGSDRGFRVQVIRRIAADPDRVHAWLLDSSNYVKGMPGVKERRVRDGVLDGEAAPYGVGTVREIISPLCFIREEITAVTVDSISYVITRAVPAVNHEQATIRITPGPAGDCEVEWTSLLRGNRATEAVLGRALGAVFGQILSGCATDLA